MDLQAIRATASDIALRAGEALMGFYGKAHDEKTKQNIFDIVTEGDRASEAVIVPALHEAFPDHHVVSEESGGTGAGAEDAEYFWHIDPVDGTSNFASNLPMFTVSIAMSDRNHQPLVGVVLNPVYNELFSAAAGHGAYLNNAPIQVSKTENLERAMLVTGFPYNFTPDAPDNNMREWVEFTMKARGIRRFGSAALELAFVAAGRLDGYWEKRLHSWDVQAGILLVKEAGGKVTDFSGGLEKPLTGEQILASNGHIHQQMMDVIQGVQAR
jgi:myo-inositol-1(or 4)-monophosphatase